MRRSIALLLAFVLALATGVSLIVAAMTVRTTPASLAPIETIDAASGTVVAPDDGEQAGVTASSQTLIQATLDRLPAAPAVLEVNRVTIPPGAHLSGLIGPGPELLLLEAGTLAVQVAGQAWVSDSSKTATVEGKVSLWPGDLLTVPTGAPFTIANLGQVAAVVLELALRSTTERSAENEGIDASALSPIGETPGISVQRLADGVAASLASGPATIAVARLTVAPGAEVAPREVVEAELVAIERGTGDLTIAAGEGQLRLATGPESLAALVIVRSGGEFLGRSRMLAAGEGGFFPDGAAYAIRNTGAGSLVLLVVQIVPTGGDAG